MKKFQGQTQFLVIVCLAVLKPIHDDEDDDQYYKTRSSQLSSPDLIRVFGQQSDHRTQPKSRKNPTQEKKSQINIPN